jgi:hypothetical protein
MKIPIDPTYYKSLNPLEEAKLIHYLWCNTVVVGRYAESEEDGEHEDVFYHAYNLSGIDGVRIVFAMVNTAKTAVCELRDYDVFSSSRYYGEGSFAVAARYLVTAKTARSAFKIASKRFKPQIARWYERGHSVQIAINLTRQEMVALAAHCKETLAYDVEEGGNDVVMGAVLQRMTEALVASGGYSR